jgi:hypothetical protein
MALGLLGMFFSNAFAFSSDGSSLQRRADRWTVWTDSAVVFTVSFTNSGASPLRKFYYAEQVPSGLIVKTLGISIDGQRVTEYSFASGEDGDVYAGCVPYRWLLEEPPGFGANNPIPVGGTVQINYSVASSVAGIFTFPQFSWVAYDPATGNGAFGYNEGANATIEYVERSADETNWWDTAQGSYLGLFYEDPASAASSGAISVSMGSKGFYSGRLRVGMRSRSFSGRFDTLGAASNIVNLERQSPAALALQIGRGDPAMISGHLTAGAWTANVCAYREAYNAKSKPAPCAGLYTIVLPGSAAEPEGHSYGSVKVSEGGLVSFKGRLADGTKVANAAGLTGAQLWPVYVPLNSGKGMLLGWLTFTSQNGSNIVGDLVWTKAAASKTRYYPNGFTNQCTARASLYNPPASPDSVLLTPAQVSATFSGGDLSSDFTLPLELETSGRVRNLSDAKSSMKFSLSTGLFQGRVVDPVSGDSLNFGGAVLLNQNMGFGLLLGSDKTSGVVIGP